MAANGDLWPEIRERICHVYFATICWCFHSRSFSLTNLNHKLGEMKLSFRSLPLLLLLYLRFHVCVFVWWSLLVNVPLKCTVVLQIQPPTTSTKQHHSRNKRKQHRFVLHCNIDLYIIFNIFFNFKSVFDYLIAFFVILS